jgi:uncharacterized protein (DUF433 family)
MGITEWKKCEVVRMDDFGTFVFRGTEEPVYRLFDELAEGKTIQEFLAQRATVSQEQVERVLGYASYTIMS